MKSKVLKQKLKTEEYNIPDVLSKIKSRLSEVSIKSPQQKIKNPIYKYSFGLASLLIFILLVFTSVTIANPKNEASGPNELSYFKDDAEIDTTLERFNQTKDEYLNQTQQIFEHYRLTDIKTKQVYEENNQVAQSSNNIIYYLNSTGLVAYDTSNNDLVEFYYEKLNFDKMTNVKMLYIINNKLVVVYNNSDYINVISYNLKTMAVIYTYSIASTYIKSSVFNNNLYLVSILNDTVLPTIKENNYQKLKQTTDIGHLDNVLGNSYTIITCINLEYRESTETIFLSFDKWDIIYFNCDNLYLINNHMNYKKNLNYGEYATIIKFNNTHNSFSYQGSYTLKGSVQDENSVYDYNNNFRIALEVTNYKLKKVFIFFTKVIEVDHSINIITLKSTTIKDKPTLELTNNYIINGSNQSDASISISNIMFKKDEVILESRSAISSINIIDFSNPSVIKNTILKSFIINSNITMLNGNLGFSIKPIKTATGEFEIKFYEIYNNQQVELLNLYSYLNYSYLLDGADYINIDAIEYSNSLFIDEDSINYYIGFAVSNNINASRTYTLIQLNKTTKSIKFQDLSSNNMVIEKLIKIDSNFIYGLSDNSIIKYKLNEYSNFIKKQVYTMP